MFNLTLKCMTSKNTGLKKNKDSKILWNYKKLVLSTGINEEYVLFLPENGAWPCKN